MLDTITDQSILAGLGADLRRERLSRNLSQVNLANEAGVTRDTVRRLESGEPVSTLTLVRVLRVLGLLDALEAIAPERGPGPLEQLDRGPGGRRRARASRGPEEPESEWRWGDETEP